MHDLRVRAALSRPGMGLRAAVGITDRRIACSLCGRERLIASDVSGVGSEGTCDNPSCFGNLGWFEVEA
jgi:hypothetical protein